MGPAHAIHSKFMKLWLTQPHYLLALSALFLLAFTHIHNPNMSLKSALPLLVWFPFPIPECLLGSDANPGQMGFLQKCPWGLVIRRWNFILLFAVQTGCHILQAQQNNKPQGNAKKSLRGKNSLPFFQRKGEIVIMILPQRNHLEKSDDFLTQRD